MTKAPAMIEPSVGIVLTTYNGGEFLADQLDSLLAQSGVSLHIYVFDDKSSDSTMAILESYAAANPGRFTVVQNDPNSGGTGLNIFRNLPNLPPHHDFVALADQDDIWLPEKVESAIAALNKEKAGLYFSNLLMWDGKEVFGVVEKASPLQKRDYLFAGGSAGCTYVLSKEYFQHLQQILRETELGDIRRISHDWIIYFLARHHGYNVCASGDALIKYRIHPESQYGGMSLGGIGAVSRKYKMLRAGFLRDQISNALLFAREGTEDRAILLNAAKGRLSRLAVLFKYRFTLVRKKPRLLSLLFAFLSFR